MAPQVLGNVAIVTINELSSIILNKSWKRRTDLAYTSAILYADREPALGPDQMKDERMEDVGWEWLKNGNREVDEVMYHLE